LLLMRSQALTAIGCFPNSKIILMREKKNNSLQVLKNVLPHISQQRGWEEQLDLHSVFVRWHELLGCEITQHCQPLKIVKKVLWVEVENSAWLQQFQFQTVVLLEILNKSLRISKIKGLRFVLAEKDAGEEDKVEQGLCYVQPSPQDIAAFEQQAGSIPDKDARDALVRFWYLSKACKKL